MKLSSNTMQIILEDFITKFMEGKATLLDLDNLFALTKLSGTVIQEPVKEFLEALREDMRNQEGV